jgi:hypothetical protein
LIETLQIRRNEITFKGFGEGKGKGCQSRILSLGKLSFRNEEEIRTFQDK